jgi:uncharacterized protein
MSRVVLDTNVLLSALILKGRLNELVDLWKAGIIHPVISRETFSELMAVLSYPKFKLSEKEIRAIVEDELLPFFEVIEIREEVAGVCGDPDDDIFLAAAINARAPHLVTGDKALLDLKKYKSTRILTAREYLDMKKP